MKTKKKTETEIDPYEAAVKWIEDEVHRHGVFEMREEEGPSYDHRTKVTSQVPTGKFCGFTVSSQHIGDAYNFLQLVHAMQREKEKRRLEEFGE